MSGAAWPFVDLALARRLERAEGAANVAFVEARAALRPESGATWTEVAGAWAMYDGVGSPLTQSFGLGLHDDVGPAEMERIERFFRERGAEPMLEVSPVAPPALIALLGERGYRPLELSSVLFQPIAAHREAPLPRGVRVRRVGVEEEELWANIAAEGWGASAETAAFMRDYGAVSVRARGTVRFLAEIDGEPAGSAAIVLLDGVALLAGASTVPRWRGRGGQRALLDARLRYAREQGADLATMAALPGGTSQRNAEREGFRIAYTRIKWRLGEG